MNDGANDPNRQDARLRSSAVMIDKHGRGCDTSNAIQGRDMTSDLAVLRGGF